MANNKVILTVAGKDDVSVVLDRVNQKTVNFGKSTDAVAAHIKKMERELQRTKQTVGMTANQLELYEASQMGATQADLRAIAALQAKRDALIQTGRASTGLNGNIRQLRGMAGQLGHQVQDVAVQLQMGADKMLVFGQQGSQIAAIMGPTGAIVGGVLAIAAALGSAYMRSIGEAGDSTKKLEKALESLSDVMEYDASESAMMLSDEFIELAKASRHLAEVQLIGKQVSAMAAVQAAQDQLRESTEDFIVVSYDMGDAVSNDERVLSKLAKKMGITTDQARQLRSAAIGVRDGAEGSTDAMIRLVGALGNQGASDEFMRLIDPIVESTLAMNNAEQQAEFLRQALENLDQTLANSDKKARERTDSLEEYIAQLQIEADTVRLNETATILYTKGLEGANFEQLRQIALLREKIDLYDAEQQALKDAEAAQRKKDSAMKEIENLDRQLMTEDELINDAYTRRQEMLNEALENKYITEQRYAELSKQIEQDRDSKITENYVKGVQARMKAASDLAGAIGDMGDKGSKAAKAAMVIQKTIAVAEATMNMHRAISQANALPFPLNIIEIGRAAAIGAGAIAGVKAASFEGGGITFNGVRSGGMDGKGGRMAMVHPNEKITDMEKSQQASEQVVTININALDARGVKEMLVDNQDAIVAAVNSASRNKGKGSVV